MTTNPPATTHEDKAAAWLRRVRPGGAVSDHVHAGIAESILALAAAVNRLADARERPQPPAERPLTHPGASS